MHKVRVRAHLHVRKRRVALQEEVELLQRQAADAQALSREIEYWRKRSEESLLLKAEVRQAWQGMPHAKKSHVASWT
jgi:hypothetical protein